MRLVGKKLDNAHGDAVFCCSFGAEASTLYTGSVDETVKRFVLSDTPTSDKVADCDMGCVSLDISPNGEALVTVAMDGNLGIYSTQPGAGDAQRTTVAFPPTEAWCARFHPSSDLIGLAAGSQHSVLLLSSNGKELKSKLALPVRSDERKVKEKFTLAVAFSPDGSKVAASDMTGGVYVFDVAEGKMLTALEGHVKPVRGICFGSDSKTILSASDDSHVHSYDLADGKLINAYAGHESWVTGVTVLPNSSHFVTASADATVRVWDFASRKALQVLTDHNEGAEVWGVAASRDGKKVASCADDGTVVVYSVQ